MSSDSTAPAHPFELGAMTHGVGHGWGEWRPTNALPNASLAYYLHQAHLTEEARVDVALIDDSRHIDEKSSPHGLNRVEPLTIRSALAATTRYIGLVATVIVSYTKPFQAARQWASLDHIGGSTLRDNLGLPVPANRTSQARTVQAQALA